MESLQFDGIALLHVHPTALAAEVAGVDDRNIEERRKKLAAFDAPLEFFDREHPLDAEVPEEFREAAFVGGSKTSSNETRQHNQIWAAVDSLRPGLQNS